ncbi:MAG: 2-C-methyl-D-erythritol 2,4-cyclodiphosphate synthase [Candidatus Omnitrophica bacterium]|nr:2-C-methyl-D-erythritol 2,4-cyclodiphosphate synthase [Candidatus Omnitrophota bacterium]
MNFKIGIGYDIHRLVKGRKLYLGGVLIPYSKGLLGHSDGDVLIHAVCDALLGAAGLCDIGEMFPDTDQRYKNIRSSILLAKVGAALKQKGVKVGNIDAVIIAQEPKLTGFKKEIAVSLSKILKVKAQNISVKAKTNEGLDASGDSRAIACYAVATLKKGD